MNTRRVVRILVPLVITVGASLMCIPMAPYHHATMPASADVR